MLINKIIQLTIAATLTVPAFAGAVQLPATGQTGCFDGTGKNRQCAGTGEDGELQSGAAWPAPRFSDNGNGTLSDGLTGLTWSKDAKSPDPTPGACQNAGGAMSWQQALTYVACLNSNSYLGFSDWRLPNLNEMESLVNAGVSNSAAWLNNSGYANAQPGLYWTSTNDHSDSKAVPPSELNAWDVDLAAGGVPLTSAKTSARSVWPVRGTSTAPAQLWQTGDGKCFDTAGVRINACKGTGQDGDIEAGAVWPIPRYQPNVAMTTAVDKLTGLVWSIEGNTPGPAACPNTGSPMTWQEALDHVKCLNQNAYLGVTSWRLPNRKELRSLADYSSGNPALTDLHPFTAEAAKGNTYWTSTTNSAQARTAWTVSMFDGSVNSADKRNGLLPVWPVTGPDALPPALSIDPVPAFSRMTAQTITGTVEAGVVPSVTVNSGAPVAAKAVDGKWSAQISGLNAGTNSITVSATDQVGNSSTSSASVTVIFPDGSFSGGNANIFDALKALRMAVGLVTPSLEERFHGDVAPLGAPDDKIDVSDALLILKKAVGLANF